MIHSSAIEGHHFLVSRRRGYDPAEVDAVVKRLVATLRKYEERDEDLSQRPPLSGPDVTDLESVRVARDKMLMDAEAVGHQLQLEARTMLDDAERTSAEQLQQARDEAERIIDAARVDAGKMLSRRNARAEALITAALSEVKALRARVLHETNEYRSGKKTEAAALVRTAELEANQLIEDARHEAGSILGRARREHMVLEQRIGQLRSAIAGIEGQFRHLAETTLEQTEVMATMISLETTDLEDLLGGDRVDHFDGEEHGGRNIAPEPEVVRLTQQAVTADRNGQDGHRVDLPAAPDQETAPAHDIVGEPPTVAPNPTTPDPITLKPVTPKAAEPKAIDERFVVAPGNTIYQRRGGGLRRRLEEEDVHETTE